MTQPLLWVTFGAALLVLLAVDLLAHRGGRGRSRRAEVVWTCGWVGVGLGFTLVVAAVLGGVRAQEYLAAYLIEKSLSLDNLFVFLVIFRSLNIPHAYQRSVLSWGILGALVFRLVFVLLGLAAMRRYHGVVYAFAGVLLFAAYRVLRERPGEGVVESPMVRWLVRHLPVTHQFSGHAFFLRESDRRVATPLFVALCAVELSDIAFAVDSVPAALAVSDSTFVVYSSNALAVLGLRSLYLVLENALGELRYLRFGLVAVLVFAALKLITSRWLHIPPLLAVAVIVLCIGASVWPSLRARRAARRQSSLDGTDSR